MAKKQKWIQEAKPITKGALHQQLHIPEKNKIATSTLKDIVGTTIGEKSHGVTVTKKLKSRANFALNVRRKK